MHTYMHTYIHAHIHTYIHTYIHSYIHAYIYTYIHIYIPITYDLHTIVLPFWSHQDNSIKPYIGLISVFFTLYLSIGLILCILTPHPNRVKKLIFSIKRLICLTLVSPIVFVMVIKVIVEVKVLPNLN